MFALESAEQTTEKHESQRRSRKQVIECCEITQAVMIRLRSSPYRVLRILTCEFRRGHLIVCGTVPTYYMKQMAQETVRPVPGVEKITNRVSVQSKFPAEQFGPQRSNRGWCLEPNLHEHHPMKVTPQNDVLLYEKETFNVRVQRQDHPSKSNYWQSFLMRYESGMNVTSVLQRIAANPKTQDGEQVAPVAYDSGCLEEVCGSCTMLINGRVRQACSALVDRLLEQDASGIVLQPMSKFPVVRDLCVDRGRLFRALEKLECWIQVDNYYDMGAGPKQSAQHQEQAYPLSQCMSCGCCLEACPQYSSVTIKQEADESDEAYEQRRDAAYDRHFIGAAAMSQAVLINSHPTKEAHAAHRIEAMIAPGGIQNCGKAGNCQAVCPKEIPLMESWGRANRAATLHTIRKFFDG